MVLPKYWSSRSVFIKSNDRRLYFGTLGAWKDLSGYPLNLKSCQTRGWAGACPKFLGDAEMRNNT